MESAVTCPWTRNISVRQRVHYGPPSPKGRFTAGGQPTSIRAVCALLKSGGRGTSGRRPRDDRLARSYLVPHTTLFPPQPPNSTARAPLSRGMMKEESGGCTGHTVSCRDSNGTGFQFIVGGYRPIGLHGLHLVGRPCPCLLPVLHVGVGAITNVEY